MSQESVIYPQIGLGRTNRLEASPKFSVVFLSAAMGAAIPLILSLSWFAFFYAPDSVGGPLRLAMLSTSVLLGAFWYRAPFSHAEVLVVRVLAVGAVAWLIPSLLATDRSHAISGWIKLLCLFIVCAFMARALRHPSIALFFGGALLLGGLILVAFVLIYYVKHLGFVWPTYKAAREFKGIGLVEGVPLNSIAFAAVFSYLMGLCLIPINRLLVALGVLIFLTESFFTGSRAPLTILAASALVLLCINGLRSPAPVRQAVTIVGSLLCALALVVVISLASDAELNHATEGRSHLWSVGFQKFLERPLFGYGYDSWRDDLVSRLPGEKELTFELAKNLAGGYHNQYVSVLAEEGLLGALAVGLVSWLVLRCSWLLAFRPWITSTEPGQWPLFTAIFLLLRANVEVPGLFGYGQDAVDYLAYLFLSVLVSRFSIEEDYAHAVAQGGMA